MQDYRVVAKRLKLLQIQLHVNSCHFVQVYTEDTFGLKTLDKAGGLKWFTVPGVQHQDWPRDQAVFQKFIEPYLL